jgi:hypothetical protein
MERDRIVAAALLAASCLLVSCSSPRQQSFYITAMDTEEQAVPCLILSEDHVILDKNNEPIRTPANLKLTFRKDSSGYEGLKLGVRPVQVDEKGDIIRGLRDSDELPYREDWRTIYPSDAKRQVFVVLKNKSFQ